MLGYLLKHAGFGSASISEQRALFGEAVLPPFSPALAQEGVLGRACEVSDDMFVVSPFTVGALIELGVPGVLARLLVGEYSDIPGEARLAPLVSAVISALLYKRDTVVDTGHLVDSLTGYGEAGRGNVLALLLVVWLCGVRAAWERGMPGAEGGRDAPQHHACCCMDTLWDITFVLQQRYIVPLGSGKVASRPLVEILADCGLHVCTARRANLSVVFVSPGPLDAVEPRLVKSMRREGDAPDSPDLRVEERAPTNVLFLGVHRQINIDGLDPACTLTFVDAGPEAQKAIPVADFLQLAVSRDSAEAAGAYANQPELLEMSNTSVETAVKEVLMARELVPPFQVITPFTDKARRTLLLKYQDSPHPPVVLSTADDKGKHGELAQILARSLPYVLVSRHCVAMPASAACVIILDGSAKSGDTFIEAYQASRRLYAKTYILYSDADVISGCIQKLAQAVKRDGYAVADGLVDRKLNSRLRSKKKLLERRQGQRAQQLAEGKGQPTTKGHQSKGRKPAPSQGIRKKR